MRSAKPVGREVRLLVVNSWLAAALALAACRAPVASAGADRIYFGGELVTMDPARPSAEALAVKGGKIVALGTRAEIEGAWRAAGTELVDLGGKTLLPGFIDPHSHYFSSLTVANQVNVYAPPAGPGKDPASIVAELVKFRDAHRIPKGAIIQAYGYDENVMPGGVGLTRDDLDGEFPDNPVLVQHVSMHGAVLNSAAMAKWNITAETETPPGGIIVRKPGSNEPAGLLMETAYLPIFGSLPQPTRAQEVEWTRAGQMLYAEAGITTAHEGATHASELAVMLRAAEAGAHVIDVIAFPFVTELEAVLAETPVERWGKYEHGLKLGGVKITGDGSPQGKTAFFSTPYLAGGPGGERDWRGEPTFPAEVLTEMVAKVYALGVPLNYHANGDAAIDMLLAAHETVAKDDPTRDRHVTVIHSQFARRDQLEKYARYHFTPSLYTLHTYYFAEAHMANRGPEQAAYMSPMRDAIDLGLHPTNHTDFVVAPLDQMFVLWSAVNRVSRAGSVIGPGQRVTPLEGLAAMTIDAARQYGEEAEKGSLEVGKRADLVVLDRSPLAVEPMAIKDIRVVETIKDGRTIWRAR